MVGGGRPGWGMVENFRQLEKKTNGGGERCMGGGRTFSKLGNEKMD